MRGGALPPALLCAALALALAFATARNRRFALGLFASFAAMSLVVPVTSAWQDIVFLATWLSVIVSAALIHLRGDLPRLTVCVAAVNAGVWCGLLVDVAGRPLDLAKAVPLVLLALPAAWLRPRFTIGLQVAGSWLIAVAVLGAALQFLPVTPGYLPDHLE